MSSFAEKDEAAPTEERLAQLAREDLEGLVPEFENFSAVMGRDLLTEGEDEEETFDDWEEDDEAVEVKSLLGAAVLPSVAALIEHDKEHFQLDLRTLVEELVSDEIDFIKLVNFTRRFVATSSLSGQELVAALREALQTRSFLADDENMKPFLADDPLLYLFEEAFPEFASAEDSEGAEKS